MDSSCREPIHIDRVLDDPSQLVDMLQSNGPYFPVQRYLQNDAEHRAVSAQGAMIIAPNFRGDWAYDTPLVEGAELFLNHPGLIEAAGKLFDTSRIRPQQVYSNITWQLPFPQGNGHTDVPAFRGINRTRYPIWILHVMGRSGLFEEERIRIATAVAWFYQGSDGGFQYWPEGPDTSPSVHEGEIFNTAIVGDNDRMFHRVLPVGDPQGGLPSGMTLETRLEHMSGDTWQIADQEPLAHPEWPSLRVSVSWKAIAFRDAREENMVDAGTDDISFDDVMDRFGRDLVRRGVDFTPTDDPLRDPAFVETLSATYVRDPSVFD